MTDSLNSRFRKFNRKKGDFMRLLMGFILAVLLGAACRAARIPMPAPNAILGSLLAVAMSSGYVFAGRMLDKRNYKAMTKTFLMGDRGTLASEEGTSHVGAVKPRN